MDKKNRLFIGDETVIRINNPSDELQRDLRLDELVDSMEGFKIADVIYKTTVLPEGVKVTADFGAYIVFNSLMKSCSKESQEKFDKILTEATEEGARVINNAIGEVMDIALREQGFDF